MQLLSQRAVFSPFAVRWVKTDVFFVSINPAP
jgi:hypothetical protein